MRFIQMVVILTLFMPFTAFSETIQMHKNLKRSEDPIIIQGKDLKIMIGVEPKKISLMAYHNDGFFPVPIQIDQRHYDGKYAYIGGRKAEEDTDPLFDENDELVFMANDLGDKAPEGVLFEGTLGGLEIEVIDPADNSKAWAYLFIFSSRAPRSKMDYVRFDPGFGTKRFQVISTNPSGDGFIVGGKHKNCGIDLGKFIYKDNSTSPDFIDRLKIRGKAKPKFFFSVNVKVDASMNEKLEGWIDGPIRIIRLSRGTIKFAFIKMPVKASSLTLYYRNHMNWQLDVNMPFKIKTIMTSLPIEGRLDFNENINGTLAYTRANPLSANIVLDGKNSASEQQLDFQSECNWISGFNDYGGLVFRLFCPKEWSIVKKTLYLNEDLERKAKPEDHPGEIGIGLNLHGIENIDSKKMNFNVIFFYLPHFKLGDEKAINKIHDQPLATQCSKI